MKKVIILCLLISSVPSAMEQNKEVVEPLLQRTLKSRDLIDGIQAYQDYKSYKPLYQISVDELMRVYPGLFGDVPPHLHQALADYVPYQYRLANVEAFISELNQIPYSSFGRRLFTWKALGYHFGLMPYYNFDQGYFYFEQPDPKNMDAILKGVRKDFTVKALGDLDYLMYKLSYSRDPQRDAFIAQAKKEWQEVAESMVTEYKIHLMPQGDPTPVIVALLTMLKKDPELQQLIAAFKVIATDRADVKGPTYPRMVIYPTQGKENAQKALNKLYTGLKGIKGLGIKPFYNAKVTDLIWIAQGDSSYKKQAAYKSYFEKPKLVYFRKDLTGVEQNYHLVHPETGQEIV